MKDIEDLEKKIKSLENDINRCLIFIVLITFIVALGSIITYVKIKELAFAIQLSLI